jgi:hypothetical protein
MLTLRAPSLRLSAWLLGCWLLLAALCGAAVPARAAEIEFGFVRIEATEEGYWLRTEFIFELNSNLEGTIQRGIPLYFTTLIEITRPRWYWTDEKVISKSQTTRIQYNPLLKKYVATLLDPGAGMGGVQHKFDTLDEALLTLRRPSRWNFAPRGALKPGETYEVAVQMRLDLDFLAKPIQVYSFNNSDWRLSSRKKTVTYKAE